MRGTYPSYLLNKLWENHDKTKNMLLFSLGQKAEKQMTKEKKATDTKPSPQSPYSNRQKIGLFLGPLLFFIILTLLSPEGMSREAQAVLASTVWIATWWITEAIPIPVTSLLPLILFPLTGALDSGATASSYGNDIIFLFMGGFLIALTMERWNLHKRIALTIINAIGTSTERIVLGFMLATGFLSMWISNTATAMMMVPVGLAVIHKLDESGNDSRFSKALMLGIAYSASIGGLGTLIGTPPNTIFAGFVRETYGVDISFIDWMIFGVPLSVILLVSAWVYLMKVAYPLKLKQLSGGRLAIQREKQALGEVTYEEKIVFSVFIFAAFAWISRSFLLNEWIPTLNDTIIALVAALLLFIIPAKNEKGASLLDWKTAKNIPWGILILFGGGLAIAAGFKESGLTQWIGEQLTGLNGLSFALILLIVVVLVIFLTEITSNTATATMMFPIMAALASATNVHPFSLMIGAGLAASCAFMLPVATPPNAVVFGSNRLSIDDMAKTGFWINMVSIILITLAIYYWLPIVWEIDLKVFPSQF